MTLAPDVFCVQEVRAAAGDVMGKFDVLAGMRGYFHFAEKKAYSGVAVFSRHAPSAVLTGFDGGEFDAEGRYVELRFDSPQRKFSLISCYFPSGSSGPERQAAKFRFLDVVWPHLLDLKRTRQFVLCGDVNIAHCAADLKNWRSNQKNSGFLPEEREWMTRLTTEGGLVDVYRRLEPSATDACYTWWSNRGQAYAKNVGWRIDYHLATPSLAALARNAVIYKAQRFSDHAPLTIDYDFSV